MEATQKLAISVAEAAELMGVSVPLVYQLVKRADFPAFKLGTRTLINRRLLETWIDREAGGASLNGEQ